MAERLQVCFPLHLDSINLNLVTILALSAHDGDKLLGAADNIMERVCPPSNRFRHGSGDYVKVGVPQISFLLSADESNDKHPTLLLLQVSKRKRRATYGLKVRPIMRTRLRAAGMCKECPCESSAALPPQRHAMK